MVVVGVLSAAWALLALPARATYGARTAADEPQYLLSALSLWDDHDLDISDELREERWRDFHEAEVPEQTRPLADGRRVSPHDPLLPALLAVPVGLAGWVGAKATLAAMAGVLAGLLVWTANRRLAVPVRTASVVVLAASLSAPFAAYGSQVYPELPAALAVTTAFAALTGPLDRRGRITFVVAVVALPWLSVKYVPVVLALTACGLWRLHRRGETGAALRVAGWLLAAGLGYVVAHRLLYGGWTVYAAGDHFVGGELTVAGTDPNYLGRSRRLLGLFVDRGFGLAAWAPVWLLVVPGVAALTRHRPPGWAPLVGALAAGWATATWIALTMHGWWWPGRQVVVVLPLAVLTIAWLTALRPALARAVAVLGAIGATTWVWLVVEVLTLRLRLIIDFEETTNPLVRAWHVVLPDLRTPTPGDWLLVALWLAAFAFVAGAGWRAAAPPSLDHQPERIPAHAHT